MKKLILLNVILSFLLHTSIPAQEIPNVPAPEIKKPMTSKDKEVIVEIFKSADETRYRLEFSPGEIYGKKSVSVSDWGKLRSGIDVPIVQSIAATYIPKTNFWYVFTRAKKSSDQLETLLGKSNAAKLNALINKYTAAGN
jgi:hypothetical protein